MRLTVLHDRTFEFTPAMLLRIEEAASGYELTYCAANAANVAQVADAEIIFGCPPAALLKHAPFLEWHHLPNSGIEPYTNPALYASPKVTLTNSRGVYGAVIAEHVLALVFALARCLPLYERRRRERDWRRDDFGSTWVEGSVVSVFGLGDLGLNVARKLSAVGAKILGVRRSLLEKPPFVDELYDLRLASEVAARSDFVVCCLPPTPRTVGLFSRELLGAMKPSAYFINVSRGVLADTDALTEALSNGRIAGAALDVTDPEPLPDGHPLWTLDNVILTPHASCVCDDIQDRKLELFLQILERHKAKRPLPNQVNFMLGY